MCGGSGTRLWPISTKTSPKQFVPLFDGKSLFQMTLERNKEFVSEITIVVNKEQLTLCESQIPDELIEKCDFIIEPVGRNTAPAIALAAHAYTEDTIFIVPADHLIENQQEYQKTVSRAQELSREDQLVTFGIEPLHPETGYGYIEADGENVISFKEKPDLKTATQYVQSENFFWNSGMFLFKAKVFLSELEKYSPQIFQKSSKAINSAKVENKTYYINEKDMTNIPANSIDYAVMEKSENVKVVFSPIDWSDLGSFDSLAKHLPQDSNGNTLDKNTVHLDSKNNLTISNKKLIATFNIEDLIIVESEDAILIGKKGQSQKVKTLLENISRIT